MKRSLALSGAIHALFFLALLLGGVRQADVTLPKAIQVRLLDDDRGGPREPARARTAKQDGPAQKASPAALPRVARVRPERAAGSAPRKTPGTDAPGVATVGASPPATLDRSSGADQPGSPAAGARVSGGSGGGAPSGEERDHRVDIIRRRIQEALLYPREARRRGIQGTSHVQFDLTDAGRLRTLLLARSSGKALLDDASLATVQRAQPFPFVDGTLIVPVEFRLSGAR